MRGLLTGAVLSIFLAAPTAAHASAAEEAAALWRGDLQRLRLEEADLAVPAAPPPYFPQPQVETFFSTPLAFPQAASRWLDGVESADGLSALHASALAAMGAAAAPMPSAPRERRPALPPGLREAVATLTDALADAAPVVRAAASSVSEENRRLYAGLYGWPEGGVTPPGELSTQRLKRRMAALDGFRSADMQAAAARIFAAVDAAIVHLGKADPRSLKGRRWPTPHGDVVIAGAGDDVHVSGGAAILIDLGGDNRYQGPVGFAGPGDIRIVIDLGRNVSVDGGREPGAGASFFGVSVFALPDASGVKRVASGDFSQGATIGGAAAFAARGTVIASAGRNAQGAAASGVGLFSVDGASAAIEAVGTAQGAGLSGGAGVFRLRGDGGEVRGGLVEPDPREPQGAVSLCQGVGVGRRALSGGGVGLCVMTGANLKAYASYFAHGSGYWHAAGAFRLRGRGALIQGRRYAQGAGVHSAFGHFEAIGDDNRILNWGAGPSHGWDRGVGSALVSGDRLEMQTDWAAGNAQAGARAFGRFTGRDGRLKLSWLGTGNFMRNESAYSVQRIEGGPHLLQGVTPAFGAVGGAALANAWGALAIESGDARADLGLSPPSWPALQRSEETARQATDLRAEMSAVAPLDSLERVSAMADVAAAFSLDKDTPRAALSALLSLPEDRVPLLAEALEPAAIEQLIQLSIALAAHGDRAARALIAMPQTDARKPLALHLLRAHRPSVVGETLARHLGGDAKIAAAALRSLGLLLNEDTGREPGALAALAAIESGLAGGRARKTAAALLARVRVGEAFGALASAAPLTDDQRRRFLAAVPADLTDEIGPSGAAALIDIASEFSGARDRLRKELADARILRDRVRPRFEELGRSTDTAVAQAAVTAAGQVRSESDARWIEPLLSHRRAAVREASAVALGRMGKEGTKALLRAARSPDSRTRATAVYGAGHAVDAGAAAVFEAGLADPDESVAMTAAAVLLLPPDAIRPALPSLQKKAARRLEQAPGRDLTMSLRTLLRR